MPLRSLVFGIERSGKAFGTMAQSVNTSQPASPRPADPDPGARRLGWLRPLTSLLAPFRRHPYQVALAGIIVEVLLAVLLSRASHHQILGLAGAEAILVGLVVAVLAGPLAGLATTTAGAVAFWAFIGDEGETAPTSWTIVAAVLWGVSVAAGGVIADALRQETAARRQADEERAELHRRLESALLPLIPASIDGYETTTLYRPGRNVSASAATSMTCSPSATKALPCWSATLAVTGRTPRPSAHLCARLGAALCGRALTPRRC